MSHVAQQLRRARAAFAAWISAPVPVWGWGTDVTCVRSNAWTRSAVVRSPRPQLRYWGSIS